MYLAKLVNNNDHAEYLMDGHLFMHTGYYYQEQDKNSERETGTGQGDIAEGSIFPGVCLYKNAHFPIYCMTMIEEKDVVGLEIRICNQMVKDFVCSNGYMVLIEYDPFIKRIQELNTEGYQAISGRVVYGRPSMELSRRLLAQSTVDNLFIKRTKYEYQNEYRIVVCEDFSEKELSLKEKGKEFSKTYSFPRDLRDITRKINIPSMDIRGDYRIISI